MALIETPNSQLNKKNVVGYAEEDDQVIVFVSRKEDIEELEKKDVVSQKVFIGPTTRKQTTVIEVGEVTAHIDGKKYRPLRGGSEIQPKGASYVGTMGGFANMAVFGSRKLPRSVLQLESTLKKHGIWSKIKFLRIALTNAHVICDDPTNPILNREIVQPGNGLIIGKVLEVLPLIKDKNNTLDCGIIKLDVKDNNRVLEIGEVGGVSTANKGEKVRKYGRTTQYQEGKVIATNGFIKINYGDGVGQLPFGPVVFATKFSNSGDSGSLVFNGAEMVVGLLFAGSDKVTIYCKIQDVLKQFGAWF